MMRRRNWEIGWNRIEEEANETRRLLDNLRVSREAILERSRECHEELQKRLARTDAMLDELLK